LKGNRLKPDKREMKSKLLIPFFLISLWLFPQSSFSQVNSYFQNNPVWLVHGSHVFSGPSCLQYDDYNYYTNGDTILNSLVYKKIFMKGQTTFSWMTSPPAPPSCSIPYYYIFSAPSYYMRSAGKRMFFKQPSDTSEYLLYNFNLQVGDTIPMSHYNNNPNLTISAIDSISTPYGYRKRFMLKSQGLNAQYLIEGIGTSYGLMEGYQQGSDGGTDLVCFSLNNISCYPATGSDCNLAVGIDTPERKVSVSVFPNPMNQYVTFQFGVDIVDAELNIYNVYGKNIRSIRNVSGKQLILERKDLNSGVYFYELKQDGRKLTTGKLVVSRVM